MEGKLIVGVILAFIMVITGSIINSESFSKPQKVILAFLIIFPPAQWILAIIFLVVKNKKKEPNKNTFEKEKIRHNKKEEIVNFSNHSDKIKKKDKTDNDSEGFDKKRVLLEKSLEMDLITKDEFDSKIRENEFKNKLDKKLKTILLEFDEKKFTLLELFENKIITKEELNLKIQELEEKKETDLLINEGPKYTILSETYPFVLFGSTKTVRKIRFENGNIGIITSKDKVSYFQYQKELQLIQHHYQDFDSCLNALNHYLNTGKKLNAGYINSF